MSTTLLSLLEQTHVRKDHRVRPIEGIVRRGKYAGVPPGICVDCRERPVKEYGSRVSNRCKDCLYERYKDRRAAKGATK